LHFKVQTRSNKPSFELTPSVSDSRPERSQAFRIASLRCQQATFCICAVRRRTEKILRCSILQWRVGMGARRPKVLLGAPLVSGLRETSSFFAFALPFFSPQQLPQRLTGMASGTPWKWSDPRPAHVDPERLQDIHNAAHVPSQTETRPLRSYVGYIRMSSSFSSCSSQLICFGFV
jgi:hypothetical protein